ncbi:cilia- and flagella-associated protein 61 [Drosophila tropicalis]|uniref:cilia- and flagella-associated protein 61 n=1 Tax=Drosophila tropicalis TaxID=46794 RepID=UPI0035ABC671
MSYQYITRTALHQNVGQIEELYRSKQSEHFGEKRSPPLTQLFYEYQTHRLAVYEQGEDNKMVAYCEFCIHPNIAVLANHFWLNWLSARFCLEERLTVLNTVFFNFAIYNENHPNIFKEVIYEVFYRELRVFFIIIAKPPTYRDGEYKLIESYGRTYYPKDFKATANTHCPSVIIIEREKIMPILSFRKALPEDNDDIVNIIDLEEPELRKNFGDFYIAELLMGTNGRLGTSHVIVAENTDEVTKGVSNTGVMWLTDSLDLELLLTNFNFERVDNLVRYTPDAPHTVVLFQVESVEPRRYTALYTDKGIDKLKIQGGFGIESSSACLLREGEVRRDSFLDRAYVFSKFKHICEELRSGRHYIDIIKKNLTVTFDTPSRRVEDKDYLNVDLGSSVRLEAARASIKGLNKAANAFLLKKFNLHPKQPVEYVFFFLSATFSAYPEHDYCLVPVPAVIQLTNSRRQLLKYCMRVNHRPGTSISEEMYVCHRSTLFGKLNIVKLEEIDMPEIRKILRQGRRRTSLDDDNPFHSADTLKGDLKRDELTNQIFDDLLNNFETELIAWTFFCGKSSIPRVDCTIVGFIVLRPFTDYEYVKKQCFLPPDEYHLYHHRGEIIMLRLHPFFQMWSDELFRAVGIKSGFRQLYYLNHFMGISFPNDLLGSMMPIEPLRQKRNWYMSSDPSWGYRRPSATINFPKINLCRDRLYIYCHNMLSSKFLGSQKSLVLIGFSDVCRAFLRLLLFGWNTKDFSNVKENNCLPSVDITVIVQYGIVEAAYDCQFVCRYCVSNRNCYINRFNCGPYVRDTTHRMDLRRYVHFVSGTLKYIDREQKVIGLDNNCKIKYSTLLLMVDSKYGFKDIDSTTMPYNYAHINMRLDKVILYHKLQEMSGDKFPSKQVLVYGNNLAVFECINFLLKHGCRPNNIIYVQPHRIARPEVLNNPTEDFRLESILEEMIKDLNIPFYISCNFVEFTFYKNEYFIEKAKFERIPSRETFEIFCDLFINFNDNYLRPHVEKILRTSGIEVTEDRYISVDENYCTNDPNIYAAGRYVTIKTEPNYQYIHTADEELAKKLISILKLKGEETDETFERRFSKPCYFTALLPCGYKIVKVTVPKRYVIGQLSNEYNETLTTYEDGDFFRVQLSSTGMINEITCVTKNIFKKYYFIQYFCGKHEALLNNLRNRWKLGLITNFLTYFEQPWTEIFMHHCFGDLQLENRKALMPLLKKIPPAQAVNNARLREHHQPAYQPLLEANVVNFLRRYRADFINQFALPEDSGWPFI